MKSKTVIKTLIGVLVIGGGLVYFMAQAMQSSWAYYYSVDEFAADTTIAQGHSVRVAGKVKPASVTKDLEKLLLRFTLAGSEHELPVEYGGTVPDNFGDGKEVVVEGRLNPQGLFQAHTLTTKCESKYEAKVE